MSATLSVRFDRSGRVPKARPTTSPGRPPRVARVLALAHDIERRVRTDELEDLVTAARAYGLTLARVTQIVNLTLLAPEIQEAILAMTPVTAGRDSIRERALRPIVAEPVWEIQFRSWRDCVSGSGQ